MSNSERTTELLNRLFASKQNLADTLTDKGEEASIDESFDSLVQKAGNYIPKTYILVDEKGNEMTGVLVEQETIFDATENDVREGKVFVNSTGVHIGEKVIPAYHTTEGAILVMANKEFVLKNLSQLNKYDFTKFQAIICRYAGTIAGSVASEKVSIDSKVYAVNSSEVLAEVTKDNENKTINLGIVNESGSPCLLRYITYKEIE